MRGSGAYLLIAFLAAGMLLIGAGPATSPSPLPSPGVPGEGDKGATKPAGGISLVGEIDNYSPGLMTNSLAATAAERAKMESPILADFDDSAQRNKHDPLLAAAMVAVGRVVYYVQNDAGEKRFVNEDDFKKLKDDGWMSVAGVPEPVDRADTLLTMHTPLAVKLGLTSGVASSVEELAQSHGLNVV